MLQAGQLDAMFYVGGTPVSLVEQLLDENVAVLVPIDGDGRKRLLARQPSLSSHVIAQGIYPDAPPIETVSVDALWITDATQPDNLIYGIDKALYNPANRNALAAQRVGAHFMEPDAGSRNAVAPLHPGAARFFTEAGTLRPAQVTPPVAPAAPRKS
jgi:TRAP transporter TAXI family solute receptor